MTTPAITLSCLALFLLVTAAGFLGHRFGRWSFAQRGREIAASSAEAAILSLLGLLIAFTFSSAYARLETRRQLLVAEVNAIGTAMLRLDLVAERERTALREQFREYVHSRFELWQLLIDRPAALQEYARTQDMQNRIWSAAVAATRDSAENDARKLLLPALNEMIDITTTRLVAVQSHPPLLIYFLLAGFAVIAGGLVGFGMAQHARPSATHLVLFAASLAVSLFVILDIEYPRTGFVTLHAEHQLFKDLEDSISASK